MEEKGKRRGRDEEEKKKRGGEEGEEGKIKSMYVSSVCETTYSLLAEPRIGSVENMSSLANVG